MLAPRGSVGGLRTDGLDESIPFELDREHLPLETVSMKPCIIFDRGTVRNSNLLFLHVVFQAIEATNMRACVSAVV